MPNRYWCNHKRWTPSLAYCRLKYYLLFQLVDVNLHILDSFLEEARGTWAMPTTSYLLNVIIRKELC